MTTLSPGDGAAWQLNRCAQSLSALHAGVPTANLVRNLRSQVDLVRAGDWAMPVTVDSGETDGDAPAWVCSPLTTYCRYAGEEIDRHLHGALAWPLRLLCRGYGAWLGAAGVDRAVAINNWLLSTNLYPALDTGALQDTIAQARIRWPRHALWFRSLNTRQHPDWLAALAAEGFSLVPSRQVWCYEAEALASARHANLRRDLRQMQRSTLARASNDTIGAAGRDDDYERIAALYGLLYLDKYSRLNPHYTATFMRHWHQAGLLELHGWRDGQGQLQAVVGLFAQGGIVTAPVVGYNTALPASLGLYRLLMATVFARAIETGCSINLSAGAGHFKRLRGGQAAIEYSAVYAAHLPLPLRAGIGLLRVLATHVGVPVMQRFQL
ncbi:hypothetical protein OR16_25142 [Cupriavidus basilensis OR16]|uniref:Uncharacterized protein n=1 Tax=Cupriavidus basilensis OR16 TaxID=1127483 RepID=H1SAA3_9BURK|nr:GNAT family N-acetyltransferase [Cupriavidus basilensis]EHP40523.1 hypothetical protein OR16_25142 [Cupriavidus basilensis OR16]